MGKTIRRKDLKGDNGWYTWKNDIRNHPKASENYMHSDMPNRDGRGAVIHKAVKNAGNAIRKTELKRVKNLSRQSPEDVETFNDDKYAKATSNKHWRYS